MTHLLDQGIKAIRLLPEDRQDMAGELLLAVAGVSRRYPLSDDQIDDVKQALAEANGGEFATDEEMEQFWADAVR